MSMFSVCLNYEKAAMVAIADDHLPIEQDPCDACIVRYGKEKHHDALYHYTSKTQQLQLRTLY